MKDTQIEDTQGEELMARAAIEAQEEVDRADMDRRAGEMETVRREPLMFEIDERERIREVVKVATACVGEEFVELRAQRDNLLVACKELLEASKHLMEVLCVAGTEGGIDPTGRLDPKFDGFGVRAQKAIAKAEGG